MKKGAWNSAIKKQNNGLDHIHLYNKPYEKNIKNTRQEVFSNLDTPFFVRCNLTFDSETFGRINLKYLPENIALEEVVRFFAILDRISKVEIDVAADGRVHGDACLHVHAADFSSCLPISVFWRAISHACKEPVRQYSSFLKIYITLFSLHGKKLYRNKPSS